VTRLGSIRGRITKNNHILPAMAFLVPFAIRLIPEILVGPYIMGFDTMGFYVPNTLAWLNEGIDLWGLLAVAPLFYTILMAIAAAGVPLIVALKVIPPLLLGVLGSSIYLYAHKGLGWSFIKSLAPALLGTIYFVALRVSWDMLRSELGLIFLFIVLTILAQIKNKSWRHYFLLTFAMFAVALSHQLAATIMLWIIFLKIVYTLYQKDVYKSLYLVVSSLPAATFFFFINFLSYTPALLVEYQNTTGSPLANWLGFSSYFAMLASEAGFFFYCFLPLIPLLLLSIKRFGTLQLRSWLLLIFILLLIPFSFVSPFRWLLLLIYPLSFYVTEALSKLSSHKPKHIRFSMQRIAVLYLILSTGILSFGFIFFPPETPFAYFNPEYLNYYQYQIPSSMQQNTISIKDFQATENALQWFKENENSTAIILTHVVFYSWALQTLNADQIRNYGFDDPLKSAGLARQEGHTQIFLIWWISGKGWYAQSTLPSAFQEVYHDGNIAIYHFNATA